jgi:hypothetical protein
MQFPDTPDSLWAFAVSGMLNDEFRRFGDFIITARNLRTGMQQACHLSGDDTGVFAIAFVDMSKRSVVKANDKIELTIADDNGNPLASPIIREVQPIHLHKAVITVPLSSTQPIPTHTQLLQNYPNPFNPETWIPYDLATDANVVMEFYDVTGKMVRRLELGYRRAGSYRTKGNAAYWNGHNQHGQKVASGLYFVRMKAGEFVQTKRLAVLK